MTFALFNRKMDATEIKKIATAHFSENNLDDTERVCLSKIIQYSDILIEHYNKDSNNIQS